MVKSAWCEIFSHWFQFLGTFGGLGAAGLSASLLTSVLPTTLEDLLALALCSAGGLSSSIWLFSFCISVWFFLIAEALMPNFPDLLVVYVISLCDWDPSNLWIHCRQEERKMSMTTLLQLHIYHDWPITATANRHQGSWCVFLANIWLAELRESRKWHLSFSLPFSSALTQTWERCMHIDKLLTAYLVACFWLGGLLHQTFELEFLFPSPWIK